MPHGDLYSVLGVTRGATETEIKQAYRRLARELHPDRNQRDPGAVERFRRVAYAYQVLSDPGTRRIYDRFGETEVASSFRGPRSASAAGGSRPASAPEGPHTDGGPTTTVDAGFRARDVFRAARGPAGRRGADLSCTTTLDLVDAVRGCEREVRIKAGSAGSDRVVRVRIPPGVQHGERLRLPGLGRPGSRGGRPGDLWMTVRLRAHPHFFLEGGNLHLHLPITPLEAYEGAHVEVPTPQGPVQVRVPPRSQSGTALRVRGRGVRRGQGEPGDLLLHVRVVLPTNDGLREAYAHLEGAIAGAVRQGLRFD